MLPKWRSYIHTCCKGVQCSLTCWSEKSIFCFIFFSMDISLAVSIPEVVCLFFYVFLLSLLSSFFTALHSFLFSIQSFRCLFYRYTFVHTCILFAYCVPSIGTVFCAPNRAITLKIFRSLNLSFISFNAL